jgi:hypothetical protein
MDYTSKYLKYKDLYLNLINDHIIDDHINRTTYKNYNTKYLKYKELYLDFIQNGSGKDKTNNDDQPLASFFIASSHNTYLESGQIYGTSSIECYTNFIHHFKGGCVEIDLQHSRNNDIMVGHGTFTGELKLSLILKALRDYVLNNFDKMLGPIILSLDNKKITAQEDRDIIWELFFNNLKNTNNKLKVQNTFFDTLLYNFDKDISQVKLGDVKGLFLIKWAECTNDEKCKANRGITPPKKYSKLVHWTHFRKPAQRKELSQYTNDNAMSSISIPFVYPNNSDDEYRRDMIKSLQTNFVRVFPSPLNINSANYNILGSFLYGAQMIALNVQRVDEYTILMKEIFKNGCMRLKPAYMLTNEIKLNPLKNISIEISSDVKYTNLSIFHPSGKWNDVKQPNYILKDVDESLPIIIIKFFINGVMYWNACTLKLDGISCECKLYSITSSKGFLQADNLNCSLLYKNWDKSPPISIKIKSKLL